MSSVIPSPSESDAAVAMPAPSTALATFVSADGKIKTEKNARVQNERLMIVINFIFLFHGYAESPNGQSQGLWL